MKNSFFLTGAIGFLVASAVLAVMHLYFEQQVSWWPYLLPWGVFMIIGIEQNSKK